MFYLQGQNANGSVIAVTNTATNLYDLINTAASTTLANAGYSFKANGINILPEDGDVRILFDSALSPTSTKGMLLTAGTQYFLRNVPLDKMKLIRTGGADVNCSIGIGICDAEESSSAVAGVGSSSLVEAVDVAKLGGIAVLIDDAAFGVGTSPVIPAGFLADDISSDPVGEGDIGAPRMRPDRIAYSTVPAGTPTLSNVSVSASNFTVLAENLSRGGVIIFNDGVADVYLKFGATATTSSFTYKITAGQTLTLPEPGAPIYRGIIDAIGSSATGTLRVTQLV